jgi:uncharacterized protein (TIGR03435 family)
MAYGLQEERFVVDAPTWVKEERYDITAKVDDSDLKLFSSLPAAERSSMLRVVLTQRFGLSYHFEPRTFSEYGLVAKKPGHVSDKLVQSDSEESKKPQWHISHPYRLDAKGITMADLCNMLLSTEARQLVVDQTGLTDKYNFQLRWSRVNIDAPSPSSSDSDDAPDIFTAVQEQLGLKMVPLKVPVKVLVIDNIDRPTAN